MAGKLDAAPPVGSLVARVGDGPSSVMLRIGQQIDQLNVRSVYLPVVRDQLPDALAAFDFAEPSLVTGQRATTSVPSQSLYLMNSPFVQEQAGRAAGALLAVPELDDAGRVDLAYRLALGRPPSERERQLALAFVGGAGEAPAQRQVTWGELYQALFACIDFRYVN